MKNKVDIREKIVNQPSYWVEGINAFLYNAVIEYMEAHNMNRTELAVHLGISKGRVSQILNDGEINFSIEKFVQIALKIDKFPIFEFKDKKEYLGKPKPSINETTVDYEHNSFSEVGTKTKVLPLFPNNKFNRELAL